LKLRSEEAAAKEVEPAAPEESADAEGSAEA